MKTILQLTFQKLLMCVQNFFSQMIIFSFVLLDNPWTKQLVGHFGPHFEKYWCLGICHHQKI